jgi:hypothetical protein
LWRRHLAMTLGYYGIQKYVSSDTWNLLSMASWRRNKIMAHVQQTRRWNRNYGARSLSCLLHLRHIFVMAPSRHDAWILWYPEDRVIRYPVNLWAKASLRWYKIMAR